MHVYIFKKRSIKVKDMYIGQKLNFKNSDNFVIVGLKALRCNGRKIQNSREKNPMNPSFSHSCLSFKILKKN